MRYSYFTLDQLMKNPMYQVICDKFIGLATSEDQRVKLESILYEGGYADYTPVGEIGRNNPMIDVERRIGLANLIVTNPATFDAICEGHIMYFHGTNANALPSILKHGLNSVNKSNEQGIEVTTGEEWSRIGGERSFVSFTDVLDVAEGYSTQRARTETELDFPVIFGTTKDDLMSTHYTPVSSAFPEVGVVDSFPRELIRCVMVPSDKVDIVRKMAGDDILVLAADGIEDKFYYIDDLHSIYIDEDRYERMKHQEEEEDVLEVRETIFTRSMSNIKNRLEQLRSFVRGDDLNERRAVK